MNSNEDYLDSLLNSVIEQDSRNEHTYQPKSVFSAGVDDENESDMPDHSDMDEINRLLEKAVSNTAEDLQTEDDIRKMFDAEKSGNGGVSASASDMADELANLHMADEPENAKEIEELLQQELAGNAEDADRVDGDVREAAKEDALLDESAEELPQEEAESAQGEAKDPSGDIGEDELAALLGDNVEELPQEEAESAQGEAKELSGDIGEDELAALLGDNVEELPQEEAESAQGEAKESLGDIGQDELAALLGDNVEEMPDTDALSHEESGKTDSGTEDSSADGDDLQALLQEQDMPDDLLNGSESDDMDALLRGLMSGDQPEDGAMQEEHDSAADDMVSLDNLQSQEEAPMGDGGLDDEINALLGMGDAAQETDQSSKQDTVNQVSLLEENADSEKELKKKNKKQKKQKGLAEDFGNLGEVSEEKKRGKKSKKEKLPKQTGEDFDSDAEKKEGFFAKLGRVLFGEDEDEEQEAEEMNISDENREVIEAVAGEKSKSGKKKKPAKGKKAQKGGKQNPDEAEGDEESSGKGKKGKPEKKKKEKKEKKLKAEENVPGWTTPKGKIFSVFAFCITILAILVILANILPAHNDLKKARRAYYEQDYRTAFQNLNGKKLNSSDNILYIRCVMILNLQNRVDHYTIFMDMDKEKIALNELMMAVQYYQDNLALAEEYGALEEVNAVYRKVLYLLESNYNLSEAEAVRINALDDLEYNRSIYYLLNGTEFILPPRSSVTENDDTDQAE